MFNIAPINIFALVIAVVLFYNSYSLLRERKESVLEFVFWVGFGIAILLLAVGNSLQTTPFIDVAHSVSSTLGFSSGVNGILIVAFLLLLMMVFQLYIQMKKQKKEIYDLDRELALLQYEYEKQKESIKSEENK